MGDLGTAYRGVRERVDELVRGAGDFDVTALVGDRSTRPIALVE